jgi:3-keto-5-aminohexanoate cleavage enzyme
MNLAALLMGGHVRLGIEDCIWFDASRARPARNVELVSRLCDLALSLELRPATCAEARNLLGLL